MHDPDDSLASFASVLAGELPGKWTSDYHPDHGGDAYYHDLTVDVWDMDQVAETTATYAVDHCAVLTRDDGTRLFVMDRKGHDDGFLIAAMAPDALPVAAYQGVREPDGIAVPDDPFRAAEDVILSLLPRYDKALAQVRHNASRLTSSPPHGTNVVMTWSGDALVVTPPERPDIADVLADHGFVRDADKELLVLGGDDSSRQAASVRAAGSRLAELGIGVVLRQSARSTLGTTAPRPAAPQTSAPQRSR
ncbi:MULTISPECIES: hypothetical protein [Streptomyces]|uniref:Uncharacterized protein n=1 Tax=Streptomyces venezuelae TaxID=54571 RepID=A0A5P2AKJ1_STRVZ|nr:hypothetical protein [Streptomyces venezuelae]QES18712.1 hypothetical protein DEJ46_06110 [Streptomyces venezuelae]